MPYPVSQLDHGTWGTGKRPLRMCHIRMCVHKDVCGGSSACPCRLHTQVSLSLSPSPSARSPNLEETVGAILVTLGLNFLVAKLPPVAWENLPRFSVNWRAGYPWRTTVAILLLAIPLTFQHALDQSSSASVTESLGRKVACIEHVRVSIL